MITSRIKNAAHETAAATPAGLPTLLPPALSLQLGFNFYSFFLMHIDAIIAKHPRTFLTLL